MKLIEAYISLKFEEFYKKLSDLWTIISQFFSQFVVTPTGCIINAMDLKNFPNNIMLLKVDRFEGFSNRCNVDELVINSMSGCNLKNCKLNNNNYKLNINFA